MHNRDNTPQTTSTRYARQKNRPSLLFSSRSKLFHRLPVQHRKHLYHSAEIVSAASTLHLRSAVKTGMAAQSLAAVHLLDMQSCD